MEIEKKDWERIKTEATEQIKQANIMLIVNKQILKTAEEYIASITKEDIATSAKPQKAIG